jgi:hypothetical protein
MKKIFSKNQKGQIVIIGLIFFSLMLIPLTGLLQYVSVYVSSEHHTIAKAQALQIAEAGIDKAAYEINQNPNYAGESNTSLGNGSFTISVSTIDSEHKRITSVANVSLGNGQTITKTIMATLGISSSAISFRYGIQTGNGGFVMSGGSTINGNVYSNGNISATTGVHITGSAIAANPPALDVDQVNDTPTPISSCTSSTCITFANATATQDFAQSFKISEALPLNNIQFYIKKVGSPGNETIRIVNDNSGSPGTDVLMTGTLSSSTVTTSFGWVTVTMPSNPVLDPQQTYWIVIDGSSNSTKYYIIGANANGYSNGAAKIGKYGGTWNNTSPSGLDGYFKIYLGGGASMIGGNTYTTGVYVGTTAEDTAWAHTVQGATVTGTIYCQTSSYTNKPCNTSLPDPTPQPLPFSENNMLDLKNDALTGGTITGDYHVNWAGATLGPKHITGNLLVDGGGTLTVSGTLWIEGTITVTGGGKVKLASSYGSDSGAIISDGYVILTGGSSFAGSGYTGSYPFLITTSSCPAAPGCNSNSAIYLSGGAGTVALVAQNGNVNIEGGSSLKAVVGKQITMSGGATLYYDAGLINENFLSGPGGSWSYVPGSYVIQ